MDLAECEQKIIVFFLPLLLLFQTTSLQSFFFLPFLPRVLSGARHIAFHDLSFRRTVILVIKKIHSCCTKPPVFQPLWCLFLSPLTCGFASSVFLVAAVSSSPAAAQNCYRVGWGVAGESSREQKSLTSVEQLLSDFGPSQQSGEPISGSSHGEHSGVAQRGPAANLQLCSLEKKGTFSEKEYLLSHLLDLQVSTPLWV